MKVLRDYERVSGQMINKEKTTWVVLFVIEGRIKATLKNYSMIAARVFSNRFLTFGGKIILINHVLQSMPIYMISTINPPKSVLNQIHQIFAKFFWGCYAGVRGKH
ncbi:hypothetical protein H5410_031506 [Solanum commersonii]|uniref:Uncharacterized protein n=1 Tax=Solanum commersonii TaxID=4109 RepID=A0A9J5YKD7_SOLCO|nr:hypothetical protein H5410_031506 [Solanum commersonii]